MRPGTPRRSPLRFREILLAVGIGAAAAGGAALVLEVNDESSERVAVVAGPDEVSYQLAQFEGISTVGPQDVVVTIGDSFSVRSEGTPAALAQFEPVVEGDTLIIRPRDGFDWDNWRRLAPATFYVTLPRLDSVAVAGSGDIRIDRLEGESFEGTIAGSGELSIAEMTVDEADFKIAGGGNVSASGTARETRVAIGGSGDINAGALRSETASIAIGGSGNVALAVANEAKVSIMGSGDVNIAGTGRCTVTRFGSGEVRCAGGGGTED